MRIDSWSWLIIVAACGAPPPARTAVSVDTSAPQQQREESELRIVQLPLLDDAVGADDSGLRFVAGGARIELVDHEPVVARMLSASRLTPEPIGGTWLFVDEEHGRVLRSGTFLGDLDAHGTADAVLSPCLGQPADHRFYLGGDGRLYTVTADEPLAPVASFEQSMAAFCVFDEQGRGAVWTTTSMFETQDGGRTWSRAARYEEPTPSSLARARDFVRRRLLAPRPDFDPVAIVLRALGVPLEERELEDEPSMPGSECDALAPGIALCEAGVFVRRTIDEWQHVAAAERYAGGALASGDGERVLLGWGCGGEQGKLCLVDRQSATARTIDRALSLSGGGILVGDSVLLVSEEATLTAIDLETGSTRMRRLAAGLESPYLVSATPVDGGIACSIAEQYGRRGELVLVFVGADGSQQVFGMPEEARVARAFDARRAIAIDRHGALLRTEDRGDHWIDTGIREDEHGTWMDGLHCVGSFCRGTTYAVSLSSAPAPASRFELDRAPAIAPARVVYEQVEGTSGTPVTSHEVRQRKLWISVAWEHEGAMRSSQGFVHGYSQDVDGVEVRHTTDRAALVSFYDERSDREVLAIARAGGAISVLPRDIDEHTPITTALDGSLVLAGRAPHVVRPNGRVEVLAGPEAVALRSEAGGTIDRAWFGTTLSGGVRLLTEDGGASTIDVSRIAPCASSDAIVARYFLSGGVRSLPLLVHGSYRDRSSEGATIDVDGGGRACLRAIRVGERTYDAHPNGRLVSVHGAELVPEDEAGDEAEPDGSW